MPTSSLAVRELPLFPLPELVLFPGMHLPLHIFEFRYRIMMNTLLQGDRCFGVLMLDPSSGQPARIGCSAEILHCQKLPDDRMKMLTIGQQRFHVLDYVREKPYLVGLVEWLDDQNTEENLSTLVSEVDQLLRDVVHLSAKLTSREVELPTNIPTTPLELSYWIASNLYDAAEEQQSLLEMVSTEKRLEREAEILMTTRNHLAARTALKDVLE
jgi:ATP-dependent Lon protease